MVSVGEVRQVALSLPRTEERLVRDRVTFRVGRIVYASISADETLMGFGFPREERAALVAAEPDKFLMPIPSDERFQWVRVRLAAIDAAEMTELVTDAWRMCAPKRVAAAYDQSRSRRGIARAGRAPTGLTRRAPCLPDPPVVHHYRP